MERYLKEIAKELKLIRIELQQEGECLRDDGPAPGTSMEPSGYAKQPKIADSLNQMFNR